MTRRMIDSAIWSNENFAALPVMARLLQLGIINMADDQGRVKAFPAYLRSQVFPYDDVAIDDIRKWLTLIAQNNTIAIYQVDGKDYIQLLNWWEYQSLQYPAPSEYPALPGWQDHIRYNAKGGIVLTYNWMTIKGERLPDTCDQRGNPVSHSNEAPQDTPPSNPPENPPETPSESPGEPTDEAPIQLEDQIEDQQEQGDDDEDAHARDPVHAAWYETYDDELPPKLEKPIADLVVECGEPAAIHGIRASVNAKSRSFKYIAEAARNYLPPAPVASRANGTYHVDIPDVEFMPGVHPLQPAPNGHSPPPAPMPTGDPWAIALPELLQTLTGSAPRWLADSRLVPNGELAGVPMYRLVVTQPGANAQWLTQQAEPAIRKKLSSLLGHRVLLEISAAHQETAP